ncbi:MAG TPA: hypothetical protein VK864_07775 [Longimicrobiales bacterium]|nr:hypothetical protein [Longimicrobiales bacterium]
MRTFTDDYGKVWIADVHQQVTPRHHGRWFLVFRAHDGSAEYSMEEVRWQTQASARRILATASDFELRRRLKNVRARNASNDGASELEGSGRGVSRTGLTARAG